MIFLVSMTEMSRIRKPECRCDILGRVPKTEHAHGIPQAEFVDPLLRGATEYEEKIAAELTRRHFAELGQSRGVVIGSPGKSNPFCDQVQSAH